MFEDCLCQIDKILKADDDDLKDKLEKAGFIEAEYTVDQINEIEEELVDILESHKEEILVGADKVKDLDGLLKVINNNIDKLDIAKLMTPFFKTMFDDKLKKLTSSYIESIDKDLAFKYFSKSTTNFVKKWSKNLAKLIGVNTKDSLESIINTGLKNGDSVEEVAIKLAESYSFSRTRARTIALTEMLRSHSYAKDEAYTQSPSVIEIGWRHSGGKGIKPRKHHQALDGTTVKKGEKFEIAGPKGVYFAKCPRDVDLPAGEVVNCHCTTYGVTDPKITGLSKEEKEKLQEEAIKEADKIYGK